jgi:hypothetical protein
MTFIFFFRGGHKGWSILYHPLKKNLISEDIRWYRIRWYQNLNLGETTVYRQDLFFWEHLAPGIKYE